MPMVVLLVYLRRAWGWISQQLKSVVALAWVVLVLVVSGCTDVVYLCQRLYWLSVVMLVVLVRDCAGCCADIVSDCCWLTIQSVSDCAGCQWLC